MEMDRIYLGKYAQFPRYELISMGLISPFKSENSEDHSHKDGKAN